MNEPTEYYRVRRIGGDGELKDESKFQSASLFGLRISADNMMEGEVEAKSESLGRPSRHIYIYYIH